MNYLEAIAYAKSRKVVLPAEYYGEYSAVQRNAATTIAGMASLDQIKAVIDLMQAALAGGKTFAQFKAEVDKLNLGLPRGKLDNIFRTNIQVAYAQGRYKQQDRSSDSRPYLLYSAVNDSRTRPSHLARNGTILRRDHPWWLTNTPPCGYRCRCTVISLTEAQARKRGISAAPPETVSDKGWEFHPSEFNATVEKAQQEKLTALEFLTKAASPQISSYTQVNQGLRGATSKALSGIPPVPETQIEQVLKIAKIKGLSVSVFDATLVIAITDDDFKKTIEQAKEKSEQSEQSEADRQLLKLITPNIIALSDAYASLEEKATK
jgi:SPP1 gp7 family putative phage head morphogenesis protein